VSLVTLLVMDREAMDLGTNVMHVRYANLLLGSFGHVFVQMYFDIPYVKYFEVGIFGVY